MRSATSKKQIIGLSLIRFSYFLDFMIVMPLGPFLMREMNISAAQFGLLVSSYSFSAGCSGLINSLVVDRFERKRYLLFFFLLFTISTLLCGLSPIFSLLLLSRVLTGLAGGVLTSSIYTVVSDLVGPEKRGSAIGIIMSATGVAFVMGAPLSLYLANHFSWKTPFLIAALISLAIFIYNLIVLPTLNAHIQKDNKRSDLLHPYREICKRPEQRMAILLVILLALGQYSIIPFISPFLMMNNGITHSQLSLLFMIAGFFSTVSSPFIGRLSDKFGNYHMFLLMMITSIVVTLSITNIHSSNTLLWGVICTLYFVSVSGRVIPTMSIITSICDSKNRASFLTIQSTVQQFSSSFATFIASIIISKRANGEILNFDMVGSMAVISALLAIVIITNCQKSGNNYTVLPKMASK